MWMQHCPTQESTTLAASSVMHAASVIVMDLEFARDRVLGPRKRHLMFNWFSHALLMLMSLIHLDLHDQLCV